MNSFYKDLTETINANHEIGLADDIEESLCPQCGKTLVVKRSRFGKLFKACPGFPHCRYTESIM